MKKIFIIILCLSVSLWGLKVYAVNKKAEKPITEVFEMNEWVEYGDDYFMRSTENRNGYSIKVLSAELLEYNDFIKENNIKDISYEEDDVFRPKYIFDVQVVIKNKDNNKTGIDTLDTTLNTSNNMMQIHCPLFDAMNPQLQGSPKFSLKGNSEKIFHFPYAIANETFENNTDYEKLKTEKLYLRISHYPVEKLVEINL